MNERLQAWIEGVYHRSEHSALGTTPVARWQKDIEQVRQLPPASISAASSSIVWTGWCGAIPLSCCATTSMKPPLAGHTVEVRFDPVGAAEVEVWFQGQLQAAARRLDPVVNGQLPSAKPAAAPPTPDSTGIVELVNEKNNAEEEEEGVPW